jgi:hypothetical protein
MQNILYVVPSSYGMEVMLSCLITQNLSYVLMFLFSVSFLFIAVMNGALSPWHGASSVCRWRSWPAEVREAVNILYKQSQTADKGWSCSWSLGKALKLLSVKTQQVTRCSIQPQTWTDFLE